MKSALFAFVAGLVFGIGLIVSGMANPAKVTGFLDLFGRWDPSLAFVMAGAIAVALPAFVLAAPRSKSLLGTTMLLPAKMPLDRRLVGGSLVFGVGWGLAGFCPGPAVVATGMGIGPALLFLVAMLAGMGLFELIERGRQRGGVPQPRSAE